MPIYEVTEVGSSGGSGCVGILIVLGLCALALSALEDSCQPTPRRTTEHTTPSESKENPAPPSTTPPETKSESSPPPAPKRPQPEQSFRQKYVNGWVLQRLREENRPVALVAMYGTTAFEDRIAQALRERGVNAQTGALKRVAFRTDLLFERLKGGDPQVLRDLGLARLTGHIVLLRLSLGDLNETREGYLTNAYLSSVLVPLEGGRPVRREFEAEGGGFTAADAEEQARERVRSDFLASTLADRLTLP